MSTFATAIQLVLEEEGGYVNHPSDPGGATNRGITQRTLDRARKLQVVPGLPASVRQLTLEQILFIYWYLYWVPAHGPDLPAAAATFALDVAVLHGPDDAIRFVQLALGIPADGMWGPLTAKTVAGVKDWRKPLQEMAARRAYHFMKLDAIDDTFGLGWSRRLFRVYDAATALLPK